ncbi:SurA N-terminal domain-containing protein [Mesorhizobium sp. J18]|uniref:peptidylprolyl isomerase n=1 Tax=Mesorhizobium sp. J18 TaxID=935263 RepID=UPI0011A0F318|nr:SurA N-terminal domain-containing protein [Mesorhizobium sp. J18]
MTSSARACLSAGLVLLAAVAATPVTIVGGGQATAAEIKYIVNNMPVTSYDIERRVAFLRLQRRGGNVRELATQDMIDQTLRLQEMQRLNIDIPDTEIDAAYARFASNNKITPAQLDQALAQAGVTKAHFKEFIRSQIGWSRVLQARFRSTGQMTEQDAVQKMLQQGGQKPSATEYMLQQVIFVVPESERSQLGKRKREAQAMRDRFRSCETTREFAKGLLDVTVRDLGRVIEPELPPDWKKEITATSPGSATPVRETNRGVEFIGVCSTREVSDDRVAQMVFQSEQSDEKVADDMTKEYMAELREKAKIIQR